ncbi:MAG: LamG domain-containing protein [Wenzhouxiangellaceae bacterium]|nr:MAG: LamG domain-containing protein [Wenzhouxiangellaceae bacterium]
MIKKARPAAQPVDQTAAALIPVRPWLPMLLVAWLLGPSSALAGLVAEWRMDEAEWAGNPGEVTDSSGNGLHGTAVGQASVPTTMLAKVCNGGRFRGQGFNIPEPPWYINAQHRVEVGNDRRLSSLRRDQTNAQSLSGWFRPESLGGGRYALLHKGQTGDQEYLVEISNGRLQVAYWDRNQSDRVVTVNHTLQTGQWYFFGAAAEGSGANLALSLLLFDENAQLLGSNSQVFGQFFLGPGNQYDDRPHATDLRLGAIRFAASTHFFDGLLDEVRIHSSALDQAAFASLATQSRDCPATGGLVAEYLMEQASWSGAIGEVLDTGGNDFHGTAEGTTRTAATAPALSGNPGSCRYGLFDGEDSGIYLGSGLDFDFGNELTVMAWVRWSTNPALGTSFANIISAIDPADGGGDLGQFWLQHATVDGTNNRFFEFAVRNDSGTRRLVRSTTQPQPGIWYHLTGVYDGQRVRIFVNGQEEIGTGFANLSGLVSATHPGVQSFIGRWARTPGNARRFTGKIDEVRVFNKALDSSEINNWMNTRRPCEEQPLNHIRIEHSGAGLTCQAETITLRACADDACSEEYNDQLVLEFTSPSGSWTPGLLSFTGQASASLQVTEPGSVVLSALSNPAAPIRCFVGTTESCLMNWAEAGFVIELPDHVSATTAAGVIRAVRADDEGQVCTPAFGDVSRQVSLWSEYLNPTDGTVPVSVNGVTLAGSSPGTMLSLEFDSQGTASLSLVYPDAGRMNIRARYEGTGIEAGLVMTGQGRFVARPAQLLAAIDDNPEAESPDGPIFRAAGQPFTVRVGAVNAAGALTGNFGRESQPETATVSLVPELASPAGGHLAGLLGNLSAFGSGCPDFPIGTPGEACGEFQWHEVGSLRLLPTLSSGPYLGFEAVPGTTSVAVGRFIPSHFTIAGSNLINRANLSGCNSDFTYLGEALGVEFTLVARSTAGLTTRNYEGAYARMSGDQLNLTANPAPQILTAGISWDQGMGAASAMLRAVRGHAEDVIEPYAIGAAPVDSDGAGLQGSGVLGSSRLLFGRVVIDNAIGSELGPLDLPWRIEHRDNQTWQVNPADNCTRLDLSEHVLLRNGHGEEASGSESITLAGGGATAISTVDSVLTAVSGQGRFRLSASMSPGWVELLLGLDDDWPFLRDDLDANDEFVDNPSARATFGLFDGNPRRIMLREVMPR